MQSYNFFFVFQKKAVILHTIYINIRMKIQIINGPNLNLLGQREPGIYGSESMDNCLADLRKRYPDVKIDYYQSNVEGELIDKMQQVGFFEGYDGIVLNAGAYTHTSIALHDCIREEFRHHSMISAACQGVICGFGLDSYRLAIEAMKELRVKS